MPFTAVARRFGEFLSNLKLTDLQIADGRRKYQGITACLNQAYWDSKSDIDHCVLAGSWGKNTRMRPPRDIDIYFELPKSVFDRLELRIGNKQSALLQDVRNHLLSSYPNTAIKGDGPVVRVGFGSIAVEVVPSFKLTVEQYYVCHTANGGSYKTSDPKAEIKHAADANQNTNGNARALIKYMKCWQAECNVPLKSFWMELLAINFLSTWQHKKESFLYHDFMVRDFLEYLVNQKYSSLYVPGTYEVMLIGDAWHTRAQTALGRAKRAVELETNDQVEGAGTEWQKIFGSYIPMKA